MSKNQYLLIRSFVNSKLSFDLFPSYQSILVAKKDRYSEKYHAEVELQSLLDKTAIENLIRIGKWGFDGINIKSFSY